MDSKKIELSLKENGHWEDFLKTLQNNPEIAEGTLALWTPPFFEDAANHFIKEEVHMSTDDPKKIAEYFKKKFLKPTTT